MVTPWFLTVSQTSMPFHDIGPTTKSKCTYQQANQNREMQKFGIPKLTTALIIPVWVHCRG
jgi:hypothetical protein